MHQLVTSQFYHQRSGGGGMMKFSSQNVVFLVTLVSLFSNIFRHCFADPTNGFLNVPLTEDNFEIQRPYNIPLEQRYSYENGTRRLWVYADDKPHDPNSHTMPRTEIRIKGLDYSSGVWQFEGYGFVPNGTSGATIVQIHGASHGATTIMLRIIGGNMNYYCGAARGILATQMYDKWFKVNLIHDVDGGKVTVYLDGVQKVETEDRGPGDLYFKCGVYAASTNISYYMESRWRDIKIYKK